MDRVTTTETSRVCRKCEVEKPIEDFYAHPSSAGGRNWKCKACANAAGKAYYAANPQAWNDRARKYTRRSGNGPLKNRRKKDRARQTGRYQARRTVQRLVREGRLVRLPCIFCGDPKTEAHHDDHNKPLDVKWVCFRCHREKIHGQIVHTK